MPHYRQNRVPGATYFFTVNLHDRRSNLLVDEIETLREAVRMTRQRRPFHIDAWGRAARSHAWKILKTLFSKSLPASERRSWSMLRRGERGVWQRRYWEHTIREVRDYGTHMDYIHFNPVKHGLAADVGEWPFSSFPRCVAASLYPADWFGGNGDPLKAGERI